MLTKKIAALGFAVALCSGLVFAQGFSVSASNELGSDIVYIRDGDNDFGGIYNEFIVDVTSARVDAGLDVYAVFNTDGGPEGEDGQLFYDSAEFDWYAIFRPIDVLDVAFSADYWLRGSYLFVEDDNVTAQKIGNEGISLVFTGLPNLKLGFTAPFGWGADDNDYAPNNFDEFVWGLGGEYIVSDTLVVGAAVQNIASADNFSSYANYGEISIGASVAIYPLRGVEIFAGYGFQDYNGICDLYGQHLINASVLWAVSDNFALSGDIVTNLGTGEEDDVIKAAGLPMYDFYAAIRGDFRVTEPVLLYLTLSDYATFNRDDDDNAKFCVNPGIEFDAGSIGTFSAEVMIEYVDGDFYQVYFPVSWLYEF